MTEPVDHNPEKALEPPRPDDPVPGPPALPLSRRGFLGLIGLGALALGGWWFSRPFEGARALGRAIAGKGWHDYLPAKTPDPERLAMIIDLQKLTAEKAQAIQTACHLAHNVPLGHENLAWVKLRTAGQMFAGGQPGLDLGPIPSFCHHCDRPLCVSVCPTGATFKRPNGLVAQDPHRCLGCRFCQKACPFEARSYNPGPLEPLLARQALNRNYPLWGKGLVAKCNFCEDRPSAVPACLEAAPEALAFGPYRQLAPKLSQALKATAGHPPSAVSLGPNLYYLV